MVVNVVYALILAVMFGINSPVLASESLSNLDAAEENVQYARADHEEIAELDDEGDTEELFPSHNSLALNDSEDDDLDV